LGRLEEEDVACRSMMARSWWRQLWFESSTRTACYITVKWG